MPTGAPGLTIEAMSDGQPPARTFLVECYLPGVDRAMVEGSAARAGAAAREVASAQPAGSAGLAYLGALLVAADEVVFHAFSAPDLEVVETACRLAALPFARIVESEAVPGLTPFTTADLLVPAPVTLPPDSAPSTTVRVPT